MNICIISQEFPPYTNWGGIAAYNNEFSNMFSKMGHKVTVVSRTSKGAPEFEKLANGVDVWRIGKKVIIKNFVGRTIDKILHSNAVYKKVKELNKLMEFDVIETTEAGLEGELLLKDPNFTDKVVIQCNGSNAQCVIPGGFFSPIHKFDKFWSFKREQASLKLAQRIITTSDATRQFLLKNGIDRFKISKIYQGIDTERFLPASKSIPDRPLKVGFVGRLEKSKGIDFIWKVMDKLGPEAGIEFHFKGAVHWTTIKQTERRLKQFSKFAFYHKPGEQNEMHAYYQGLHVLLQPSHFENFGLVYVEGMASKLIVFAGINGGGSEIIKNSITGFIIDPHKDVDFVVAKLKEIALNLPKFKEMVDKARMDVIQRFSLKTCADQKIAYYKQMKN